MVDPLTLSVSTLTGTQEEFKEFLSSAIKECFGNKDGVLAELLTYYCSHFISYIVRETQISELNWKKKCSVLHLCQVASIHYICLSKAQYMLTISSFGGLVVSLLASGTQDRGFDPGRSRRIFRAKKSYV